MRSAGATRMAAARFFNALRDTDDGSVHGHLPDRRSAPRCLGWMPPDEPALQHAARRPDRPRTVRCTSASTAGTYRALAGDTLASALLANGVHLVGRSFKYHRPRGDPDRRARRSPNAPGHRPARRGAGRRPTCARRRSELHDGLVAESQNRWPFARRSISARSNELLSPLLPAGFYYKTFMWPPKAWERSTSRVIRPRRGSAERPTRPDPDRYAQPVTRIATCWWSAPDRRDSPPRWPQPIGGARVMLCDEQAEFGGSLLADATAAIEGNRQRNGLPTPSPRSAASPA